MRQRPFIFENVVHRSAASRADRSRCNQRRAQFAFHPENAGALHLREIGEDVGVRREIGHGQLRRDIFHRGRENARAHFRGAELRARLTHKDRAAASCL